MKVFIQYVDDESLVKEEVVHNVRLKYGDNAKVQVLPQNETGEGYIKFGIKELIAIDQIEYHFDYRGDRGYRVKLAELKEEIMQKVSIWFDEVSADIEKGLE